MRPSALVLALAAVAVIPAIPAEAGPSGRTVSKAYTGTTEVRAGLAGSGGIGAACSLEVCLDVMPSRSERRLVLNAQDATGRPVGLFWTTDASRAGRQYACGPVALPVTPGVRYIFGTAAMTDCAGVPTTGRLIATLR